MASQEQHQELLDVVRRMLEAIHTGDADTYASLCASDLSCFETDVAPYRIDGVDFHLSLIRSMSAAGSYAHLVRFDMLTPRVHVLGDAAVVAYTRLMTYAGPRFVAFNETRVFSWADGTWRMVHFHRSSCELPPTG